MAAGAGFFIAAAWNCFPSGTRVLALQPGVRHRKACPANFSGTRYFAPHFMHCTEMVIMEPHAGLLPTPVAVKPNRA